MFFTVAIVRRSGWGDKSAAITAILLYIVKFICRGLREKDEVLEIGDLAFHDEEAYPQETFAERVSALSGAE